jgi:hypothetical protein
MRRDIAQSGIGRNIGEMPFLMFCTVSPFHSTANRWPLRFQRRMCAKSRSGSGIVGWRFLVSRWPAGRR